MADERETEPTRPCPHCGQPVPPQGGTCSHCGAVIPPAAEEASRPEQAVADEARAQDAPSDLAPRPGMDDTEPGEDDWPDGLLPTYD